jgi:hypothetical protein
MCDTLLIEKADSYQVARERHEALLKESADREDKLDSRRAA